MADLIEGMTNEDYHAHPASGSSNLRLADSEPDLFEAIHVTGDVEQPKPSKAMVFGTHLHTLLLEPERFYRELAAPAPDCYRRSKAEKQIWAEYEEQNAGLIRLKPEERQQLEHMASKVRSHPEAAKILYGSPGTAEASIFWRDEETGLDLKCRYDWLSKFSADIKTAKDVRRGAFAKEASERGYDIQRVHYLAGAAALLGEAPPLSHICVKNAQPYTCTAYDLSDFDEAATKTWRQALRDLAGRIERNDWVPACSRGVWKLSPPRIAAYRNEYEVHE